MFFSVLLVPMSSSFLSRYESMHRYINEIQRMIHPKMHIIITRQKMRGENDLMLKSVTGIIQVTLDIWVFRHLGIARHTRILGQRFTFTNPLKV